MTVHGVLLSAAGKAAAESCELLVAESLVVRPVRQENLGGGRSRGLLRRALEELGEPAHGMLVPSKAST